MGQNVYQIHLLCTTGNTDILQKNKTWSSQSSRRGEGNKWVNDFAYWALRLTMQPESTGKGKPQSMRCPADYDSVFINSIWYQLLVVPGRNLDITTSSWSCTAEARSSPNWGTAGQLISSAQLPLKPSSASAIIADMKSIFIGAIWFVTLICC